MKKTISMLLVVLFAVYFIGYFTLGFNSFELADMLDANRVSGAMITKSVNQDQVDLVWQKTGSLENASANIPTAIVVDYRSFDTLGEVTVLFVAAVGVGILLQVGKPLDQSSGFVLRVGSQVLTPLLMILGIYLFSHGHLTPGGGFPGGAMLAAAVLLYWLGTGQVLMSSGRLKGLESLGGLGYLTLGVIGLVVAGSFLENFLDTGVLGNLFSGGIIPMVYAFIGLKVGAEVSGLLLTSAQVEVRS